MNCSGGGNRDGYKPIPLACIDITSTGFGMCVESCSGIAREQERIIYGKGLGHVYIYIIRL